MTTPDVLFVCVHNAGRSQMAAALLHHHAHGRVTVRSAGSTPANEINPAVIEVMREIGLDLTKEFPKPLTNEAVEASDVVITMGCGDACPIFPGKTYLDWQLNDPAGLTVEQVRPIRDEIDTRVQALLAEIAPEEPSVEIAIRAMTSADAEPVLAIYQEGLDTGNASFETVAPDWPTWDQTHLAEHRYVATDHRDHLVGWVAVVPVSDRCVYQGVVEHSVYVASTAQGQGVGRALLTALIQSTDEAGIWTIQTGIFPENTSSLALHQAIGFRVIGTRERIGKHHGIWRDTVTLERRSPKVS